MSNFISANKLLFVIFEVLSFLAFLVFKDDSIIIPLMILPETSLIISYLFPEITIHSYIFPEYVFHTKKILFILNLIIISTLLFNSSLKKEELINKEKLILPIIFILNHKDANELFYLLFSEKKSYYFLPKEFFNLLLKIKFLENFNNFTIGRILKEIKNIENNELREYLTFFLYNNFKKEEKMQDINQDINNIFSNECLEFTKKNKYPVKCPICKIDEILKYCSKCYFPIFLY